MLRDGFLRFCDNPEIACCKAERELEQLRAENASLRAKLAESQHRERAAVVGMKIIADTYREKNCDDGICGLCKFDADHGLDGDANECPGFETDDCFEWRGPQEPGKGETE